MHRVEYTKSVKESQEMSYISSQSSKSSFRKHRVLILHTYSALPLFYSLLRFKNYHCIELCSVVVLRYCHAQAVVVGVEDRIGKKL